MFPCIVAEATSFACEEHDNPGACTEECLHLETEMYWAGYVGQSYDPTGCRYYPEPPDPEFRLRNDGVFVTHFKMEG